MRRSPSVIAIGGSAGSIEPLLGVLRDLPASLPASILVVVHVSPAVPSFLPGIVARATPLEVVHLAPSGPLRPGRVYVAPPDHHLVVDAQGYALRRSPRENGLRPALDPLFRSLAEHHGANGIGVVLSGMLDDGTVGLQAVAAAGGVTIVQDPARAAHPSMPASAMARTAVSHVVAAEDLAPLLVELVGRGSPAAAGDSAAAGPPGRSAPAPRGPARALICPECGGRLAETAGGLGLAFACQVGHAYSPQSLTAAQAKVVERSLSAACRALEDRASLTGRLAGDLGAGGTRTTTRQMALRAREAARAADVIRGLLGASHADQAGDET